MHGTPLVKDGSRRSTDHLTLSFRRGSPAPQSTYAMSGLEEDSNSGKPHWIMTGKKKNKKSLNDPCSSQFYIADYIKEASRSTDGCSFFLALTQKNARQGPLSFSASLETPPRYCSVLALSHSLLPHRQLQLQLQDGGHLANCEILYSDFMQPLRVK